MAEHEPTFEQSRSALEMELQKDDLDIEKAFDLAEECIRNIPKYVIGTQHDNMLRDFKGNRMLQLAKIRTASSEEERREIISKVKLGLKRYLDVISDKGQGDR